MEINIFGISFDCGSKINSCMGDPCFEDHTQKCCMTCDLIDSCEAPCLIAIEKLKKGKK